MKKFAFITLCAMCIASICTSCNNGKLQEAENQNAALSDSIATITLGWPDEQPAPTDRLPLSAILHEETYHSPTRADINRDYKPKESLAENQEFLRINNKQTLAQIFTDLRYTRRDNEAISQTLLAALRQQGFLEKE